MAIEDLLKRVPSPDEAIDRLAARVPSADSLPPEPPAPRQSVLDYARKLSRGLVDAAVTGPGQMIKMAGGSDVVVRTGQAMHDRITEGLTPAGKQIDNNPVVTDDWSLGPTPVQSAASAIVESAPQMLAAAVAGGPISRYFQAKGAGDAAAKLATRMGASPKVANIASKAPDALVFGGMEGAQAGFGNAAQVGQQIRDENQTPLDTLAKNPKFVEALLATDKNLPTEERIRVARDQMATEAEKDVALRSGLSTGAIGVATGGAALPLLSKVLGREVIEKTGDSALKTFAKTGLQEAGQELPQSVSEQFIQNLAVRDYADPDQKLGEGVPNAAATGTIAGFALGGGVGLASRRPPPQETLVDPNAGPVSKAVAAGQLSGAVPTSPESGEPIDAPAMPPDGKMPSAAGAAAADDTAAAPADGASAAPEAPAAVAPPIQPDNTGAAAVAPPTQPAGVVVPPEAAPAPTLESVLTDADRTAAFDQARRDVDELAAATGITPTDDLIVERAVELLAPIAQSRLEQAEAARRPADLNQPAESMQGATADAQDETARRPADLNQQLESMPDAPSVDAKAHAAATSPTNDRPEPTDAQKAAGNYKLGDTFRASGAPVRIENPQGSTRSGIDPFGESWSVTMADHYGKVSGTKAADGEQLDAFVKPGTVEGHKGPVFVIDQIDPVTGKFDEHKAMIGYASPDEALAAYQANFSPGWAGAKAVTPMPEQLFRRWIKGAGPQKELAGSRMAQLAQRMYERQGAEMQPGAAPQPLDAQGAAAQAPQQLAKQFFGALGRMGGIDIALQKEVMGERAGKGTKGIGNVKLPQAGGALFRRGGLQLDELARRAVEAGYLTQADIDSEFDNGGVNKLVDLIQRAARGEAVRPVAGEMAGLDAQMSNEMAERALADMRAQAGRVGLPWEGKTIEQLADELPGAEDAFANAEAGMAADEIAKEVMDNAGLPATMLDAEQLIAVATSFDEAAVERAALQFDDDTDFLRAVQEIADEARASQADRGRQGNLAPPDRQAGQPGGGRQGAGGSPPAAGAPDAALALELTQPTPESLERKAKLEEIQRQRQAQRDAAPEPGDFRLSGSDRAVDRAEAAGQTGLFDGGQTEQAPAAESQRRLPTTADLTSDATEFISELQSSANPAKTADEAFQRYRNNLAVQISRGEPVLSFSEFSDLWGQMVGARAAASAASRVVDSSVDNPLRYTSGMSMAKDFIAALEYGANVGIEINNLSIPAIPKLARALAESRGSLFIDSGAFSLFRANMRAKELGQEGFSGFEEGGKGMDFDQILDRYDRLMTAVAEADNKYADGDGETANRLAFVMPDIVGNQAASIELARRYADTISSYNGRAIVPIQKGELSPAEALRSIIEIVGTSNFTVGVPSNEKAFSLEDLRQFVKEADADITSGLHFLGAASDKALTPKLDVLRELGYDGEVSADANLLRSKMNSGTDRATAMRKMLEEVTRTPKPAAVDQQADAPIGATDEQVDDTADEFDRAQKASFDDGFQVTHVFDPPTEAEVVRLHSKAGAVKPKSAGGKWTMRDGKRWLTPAQAKEQIAKWREHAVAQGESGVNSDKVVLSLFDLTGDWSRPWEEAGYQVFRFDIQNEDLVEHNGEDINPNDVNRFGTEFFNDIFASFDGMDIHAILAACPCTDFASSGARHFAAKDADGRTVESVQLVKQTLATIEYFKPAVWAIENPVGRIERLGGLPPWRLSFDPFLMGDPYTKRTLLWGRFNADLPVAPVYPEQGSKMLSQYGGKSQATKNARSATPEGFAYSFFMANNAVDHPLMTVANKYDRLDRATIKGALDAGVTPAQIDSLVEDLYYQDLDDAGANEALREAAAERKSAAAPTVATDKGAASEAAKRTRPKGVITFNKPIVGPTGASLHSYEWAWTMEEFTDARGEDRARRVSDWGRAEESADTGREIVHQFVVGLPDGSSKVVSAESALKLMGFGAGNASFKSTVSAAKTLARAQMALAEAQQQLAQWDSDRASVDALVAPVDAVQIGSGKYDSGGEWTDWGLDGTRQRVRYTGALKPGDLREMQRDWRDMKMRALGWGFGGSRSRIESRISDIEKRIKKAQAKLDATVGTKADAAGTVAEPYAQYAGQEIQRTVTIEETGQTAKLDPEDAAVALRESDARLDAARSLLECLQ